MTDDSPNPSPRDDGAALPPTEWTPPEGVAALPPTEWMPPEDVATPVPATRVASGDERPPVRSRLRWGVALLVSLLVAVLAGGAFYLVTAASPTSALLADVPGDALYYAELRADLPGGQRQALGELLSGFPGFADRSQLEAKLSETVDKLLLRGTNGKFDYSTQIKPWFGGQVALAVPNLPTSRDLTRGVPSHLLALATVTDGAKANDWVKSVIGAIPSTTDSYGGVTLTVVTQAHFSGAFGVKGQVLLLGDLDSVKAGIDAESKGSLRDSDQLKRAASSLPGDHLAFFYMDNKRLLSISTQNPALGGEVGGTLADLQGCITGDVSWSAGTVRADGKTLVVETATPRESAIVPLESTFSRVAPHLPASTVAVLDVHEVGKLALGVLDHCRSFPRIAEALTQVDAQVNALGGYASYLGWIGDTDFVLTRDNGKPSGGIVIVPAEAAGAQRVATQIRNLIALGGGSRATVTDETYNGTTITTIGATAAQAAGISHVVYALRDDVVVIGVESAFVKAVLDTKAEASLATADRYKGLIGRVPDKNFQQVYVDLTATREILEGFATGPSKADYDREYKPYLEPFDGLAAAGWTDGDLNRGRAILQIK